MRFRNEDAVSPVIGVILMTAITVILAAVVAVVAIDMTDGMQTSNIAAATAKVSGNSVIVTYQGGPGIITELNSTVYTASGANANGSDVKTNPGVGYSHTFGGVINDTVNTGVRIVVAATFDDGTNCVILDENL